jgi:choline dehydrogenase-like flavoprotein
VPLSRTLSRTGYTPTLTRRTDLDIFVEHIKFIRSLAHTEPLASILGPELNPGPAVQTDAEIAAWVKAYMATTYHTAGSTAMLPRARGGVVDARLKVYGTQNLRVVDLGVVPLHIAAHTQATVYTIAEQGACVFGLRRAGAHGLLAADIIKGKFVP